jgi:signal transduction histidine kinase
VERGEPARTRQRPAARGGGHLLLEAVAGLGDRLEPHDVLEHIVETAMAVTGARYGALGLIGEGQRLSGFVPVGMSEAQIDQMSHWPEGRGLLGELIRNPRPLRLPDISSHPSSSGFPPGHPPMRSFLGAPVLIRDELFGCLFLTDKRGADGFSADDESLLTAVASAAGLAVENARLRADVRRQEQWQHATADVTQRLLSADEPRDVLALVTQHALEISVADAVAVALPDASGEYITVITASGSGAESLVGVVVRADESASGTVLATGERMTIDEYSTDNRIAAPARQVTRLGPAVVVPLGVPGDVLGVMVAARRVGSQPLPPSAVEVLTTFATQAGIGLKLAGLRRDAQQIALLADRDRIARDLHDLVIQRLFATGMSLQGVVPLLRDPDAADRVGRAVDELDGTIGDIRSAIYTLQSRDKPDVPGVRDRIAAVTEEMTPALGFTPWLRIDGPFDDGLPAEIAEDILAVVREGLSNAARHARASHVNVVVLSGDDLSVMVEDNGAGIPARHHWSGLANLTERARELGGSLDIARADQGGTRLVWRVPLPADPPPSG